MSYTIRPAKLTDLQTLLTFEEGIINTERPFDSTLKQGEIHYYDLGELIRSDQAEVLVAEYSEEIVGSGYAKILAAKDYLDHEKYIYLGFMFVKEQHRGKGVNKMILDGLIAWSDSKGLKEIRLQVYDDNEPALKAYTKSGFKKHLVEMRLVR